VVCIGNGSIMRYYVCCLHSIVWLCVYFPSKINVYLGVGDILRVYSLRNDVFGVDGVYEMNKKIKKIARIVWVASIALVGLDFATVRFAMGLKTFYVFSFDKVFSFCFCAGIPIVCILVGAMFIKDYDLLFGGG
jgi:hypothetical protein